jgi:hypothetical protein
MARVEDQHYMSVAYEVQRSKQEIHFTCGYAMKRVYEGRRAGGSTQFLAFHYTLYVGRRSPKEKSLGEGGTHMNRLTAYMNCVKRNVSKRGCIS